LEGAEPEPVKKEISVPEYDAPDKEDDV